MKTIYAVVMAYWGAGKGGVFSLWCTNEEAEREADRLRRLDMEHAEFFRVEPVELNKPSDLRVWDFD